MLKQLFTILLFFSLISLGYSTWCYQETANQSHVNDGSCSLDYTGSYSSNGTWANLENVYDGNWSSYGNVGVVGTAFLFVNYTKPINAKNTSFWSFKGGLDEGNWSIPSVCWDYDSNRLILAISSYNSGFPPKFTSCYCYNGTDFQVLNTIAFTGHYEYEEAMWWDISDAPTTTTQSNNIFPFQNAISLFITITMLVGYLLFS